MVSAGTGALRLTRALALAVAAYGLALGAHVAGGGATPSTVWSAVLLFATWWASVLVTHRRLGRTAMCGVVALSQVVLHQAFSLAGTAGTCVTVVHSHVGHLGAGATTVCAPQGGAAMGAMAHHGSSGSAMLVAHAVAALLLALVLARGEAAVWFLAGLVRPALPSPVRLPAAVRPVAVSAHGPVRTVLAVVPGEVGRRGPPRGCAPAVA